MLFKSLKASKSDKSAKRKVSGTPKSYPWSKTGQLTLITCALLFSGCENVDTAMATTAALEGVQAMTLTDEDIKSVSRQAAAKMDQSNQLAPPNSPYAQRLQRLVRNHQTVQGVTMNYAVYLSDSVNAFAMPDGTVRVYSGLMDLLNDDELLFVIGHEIGHVILEHSKRSTQLAMSASAIRKGTASVGGTIGDIAKSDITSIAQNIVQAQFSQKEEKSADDFGYDFLKRNGLPLSASVSALRKLGNDGGGILSTHPNPQDRADRLEKR